MSTACLNTVVRNTDSARRTLVFGFLPPHGKKLAWHEEYEFPGDLMQQLSAVGMEQKMRSLRQALTDGAIVIVRSPSPHYYDETLDVTKVVKIDNNALSATNPCWGPYSSSIAG